MEQAYLPVSHYLGFTGDAAAYEALPERIKRELQAYRKELFSDRSIQEGPCVWLNLATMQCRHYEHRPDICRDRDDGVVPGNEACLNWRKEYGLA